MPDIPYTPIPEQPRTSGNPVLANPNAAAAPWRAAAQVGGQIAGVGAQLAQMSQKRQRLKDASASAELDIMMGYASDNTDTTILKEYRNDHEAWVGVAEKEFDEVGKALESYRPKVSEERYERMQRNYLLNRQAKVGDLQKKAITRQVQLEIEGVKFSAEQQVKQGDLEGAEETLRELDLPKEQFDQVYTEIIQKGEREAGYEALRFAEESSIEDVENFLIALDKKENDQYVLWNNIDQQDRRAIRGQAQRSLNGMRTDFFNELLLGIESGNFVSPQQVRDWKEMGRLTPGQANLYISRYNNAQNVFDPKSHAEIRREIVGYNPDEDPTGEEYSMLLGKILGQPEEVVTSLRTELKSRLDRDSDSLVRRRVGDRLKSLYSSNFFSGGYDPIGEDQMLDTEKKYLALQEEADYLVQKYPDKTSPEIMELLFSENGSGTGTKMVADHAAAIVSETRTVSPSIGEKREAARNAYFRGLKASFPGITKSMTYEEAVKAASTEQGLTALEIQRLRRFYAN